MSSLHCTNHNKPHFFPKQLQTTDLSEAQRKSSQASALVMHCVIKILSLHGNQIMLNTQKQKITVNEIYIIYIYIYIMCDVCQQ